MSKREKRKKARNYSQKKHSFVKMKRTRYPRFYLLPGDAPEVLVHAVQKILGNMDWEDESYFNPTQQKIYRAQREQGYDNIINEIVNNMPKDMIDQNCAQALRLELQLGPGHYLFSHLEPRILNTFFPFHNVDVIPVDKYWVVLFRSLKKISFQYQNTYTSLHQPAVIIGGKQSQLLFSKHAIERAQLRTLFDRKMTYADHGDLFSYFYDCCRHDLVSLPDGQPAVIMWMSLPTEGFLEHGIADEVLPDRNKEANWLMCYGYFPLEVNENQGVALAKTLLFPGFKNTPEFRSIQDSTLPLELREKLRASAPEGDKRQMVNSRDESIKLIKLAHESGINQFIEEHDGDYASSFDSKAILKDSEKGIWIP